MRIINPKHSLKRLFVLLIKLMVHMAKHRLLCSLKRSFSRKSNRFNMINVMQVDRCWASLLDRTMDSPTYGQPQMHLVANTYVARREVYGLC